MNAAGRRLTEDPADDVLTIPTNAAGDIIPQLLTAMRVRDAGELLAAWRKVQIPTEPIRDDHHGIGQAHSGVIVLGHTSS